MSQYVTHEDITRKYFGTYRTLINSALMGKTNHPLYGRWALMWSRCTNPAHIGYQHYGARGITVCDRWKVFEMFVEDMGERPPHTSLDRINNNGNYEPSNCRWATKDQQHNNRSNHRFIHVYGERMRLQEASRRFGINVHTLINRIYSGWDETKAATYPVIRTGRNVKIRNQP